MSKSNRPRECTVTPLVCLSHPQTLEDLRKVFREKEEKYKGLASLEDMNKKLDNLKNQMAWALVSHPLACKYIL